MHNPGKRAMYLETLALTSHAIFTVPVPHSTVLEHCSNRPGSEVDRQNYTPNSLNLDPS